MRTELAPTEWQEVSVSRDEALAEVHGRARRIRWQRRTPVAAAGLGALALLVSVAVPNGSQPSSVRTANDGDESHIVDEDRTVEHEGTGANAKAKAQRDRKGTSVGASAEARKDGETVYGTGAEIDGRTEPTVALTGHPLITDPKNDDARADAIPTGGDEAHQPSTDILTADITLDGSDLEYRIEVEDLDDMTTRPEDEHLIFQFGFQYDNVNVSVDAKLDNNLTTERSIGFVSRSTTGGIYEHVGEFPASVTLDRVGDAIVFRASLEEINRWVAQNGTPAIAPGTKLTFLNAWSSLEMPAPGTFGTLATGHSDQAMSGWDEYWAVGS